MARDKHEIVAVLVTSTGFGDQALGTSASTTRPRRSRIDCQIRDFIVSDREMVIEHYHLNPPDEEKIFFS